MDGEDRRPTSRWALLGVSGGIVLLVAVLLLLSVDGALGSGRSHGTVFGVWDGFLLLFLVLWVAFFLVRVAFWTSRRARYRPRYGGPRRAVAIVRERYARGEITREQYDPVTTDLPRRRYPPGGP